MASGSFDSGQLKSGVGPCSQAIRLRKSTGISGRTAFSVECASALSVSDFAVTVIAVRALTGYGRIDASGTNVRSLPDHPRSSDSA